MKQKKFSCGYLLLVLYCVPHLATLVSILLASVAIWHCTRGSSSLARIVRLATSLSVNPAPDPIFIRIATIELYRRTGN